MPELRFVALPLPRPLDMYNAAFEKVSDSWTASASCTEAVCQAILLKLIVPFAVMCCSIREIKSLQLRLSYKPNCRLGKIFFISSLSPIYSLLFNTQIALSSSLQSLASSLPSFHTESARNTMPALHHHFTLNRLATLLRAPLMLGISLHLGWLAYVSCLVLAAGLSVAGHSVTYPCPGTTLRSPVLRLDEASIEDLNTLQATHLVRSVDLVHACPLSLYTYHSRLSVEGIHSTYS